jgi:hypothetical protein
VLSTMIRSACAGVLLAAVTSAAAGCGPRPERAIIAKAGLSHVSLECAIISNTRTTVCSARLDSSGGVVAQFEQWPSLMGRC